MNEAEYLMKNYGDRGGCYRITPSEIFIILHMIRKPNSIIVLLFIQNNSQFKNMAKTCLPPSIHLRYVHLQRSSSQCTFRFVQLRKYSPNRGPFIFHERGGAGGIGGRATRKKIGLKGEASRKKNEGKGGGDRTKKLD